MRSLTEIIRIMYQGVETHPIFVALCDTINSLLQGLKSLNTQYNPLVNSTPEPTIILMNDTKCEPSLSREIFMASGIVVLTAVVIKHIWSSTRECNILEDCQRGMKSKYKKENSSRLKELYKTLQELKNYLTAPSEVEAAYPIAKRILSEKKKGTMLRGPYSEVCKQQSMNQSVNQYEENEEKYTKVKENLLRALTLFEEQMESKEMDDGDATSKNLGYWSNKEEIIEALRVLASQESTEGRKSAEISQDGERTWSKYSNVNTPQSAFEKKINVTPFRTNAADQYRQLASTEEIVEALRVLGIIKSNPTGRNAQVSNEIEKTWSKYPNSNQPQSIFENEVNAKPRMSSPADQFTDVSKTEQALLPYQELGRNGRSDAANAIEEYKGLDVDKSCCKQNDAQKHRNEALKLSLMDMQTTSMQQKGTCDCSSMELCTKQGKESTELLNLTASRNTINIELLLNRNIR